MAKFTFPSGCVAVAGSRTLPKPLIPAIASISRHIAYSSGGLSVGCCLGVDQAVINAVEPSYLHIHTIFNSRGIGSWSGSAVHAVLSSASAGSNLTWLSGGPISKPLNRRLSSRTHALVSYASAGLLAFFVSKSSRGTSLACKVAINQGLPVLSLAPNISFLPNVEGVIWIKVNTTFPTKNLLAFQPKNKNYRLFR